MKRIVVIILKYFLFIKLNLFYLMNFFSNLITKHLHKNKYRQKKKIKICYINLKKKFFLTHIRIFTIVLWFYIISKVY